MQRLNAVDHLDIPSPRSGKPPASGSGIRWDLVGCVRSPSGFRVVGAANAARVRRSFVGREIGIRCAAAAGPPASGSGGFRRRLLQASRNACHLGYILWERTVYHIIDIINISYVHPRIIRCVRTRDLVECWVTASREVRTANHDVLINLTVDLTV